MEMEMAKRARADCKPLYSCSVAEIVVKKSSALEVYGDEKVARTNWTIIRIRSSSSFLYSSSG